MCILYVNKVLHVGLMSANIMFLLNIPTQISHIGLNAQ